MDQPPSFKRRNLNISIPGQEDRVQIHQTQPFGAAPRPGILTTDLNQSDSKHQLQEAQAIISNSSKVGFIDSVPNPQHKSFQPYRIIPLLKIVILLALVTAALLLISFYHCAIPIFSACRPQKTTLSPLIVSRPFKASNCYLLRYTSITVTNNGATQSRTRTNTSLYLCVRAVSEEGNLLMIGYDKKISEEDISLNPPNISYSDTSVGIQSCLFADNNQTTALDEDFPGNQSMSLSLDDQYGQMNGSDLSSLNITQGNETINSSNVEDTMNKLTMFRVSVFRNGTIDKIQFNTLNDNMTIANIPKYVKLFFPSLDLSLYYRSQSRLLQEANATNSTSGDIGMDLYSFESTGQGVTLTNQQIIPPDENEQVNSNQEKSSTSVFDSNNNLVSSDMSGSAELEGRYEEPNSEYQVFNFNLSLALDQNVSMQVGFTYDNLTSDIVDKFQSYFIARVVENNNSLSLSEVELKQYLLNPSEDTNDTNATRLLLAADGSLQLYTKRRQFNLLKTNLLGLPVVVTGIIEIFISIYDLGNYLKQPRFVSRALLRITLGPFKLNYVFFQLDKRMEPLSLSFTLQKIEGIIELTKGGFISKVKQLAELPSLLRFDSTFVPKLMNVGSLVNRIYSTATGTQNQLLPINQVQTIFNSITAIKNAIESQGASIIAQKTVVINQMLSAIDSYYNSTYLSNLNIFNTVRSQLSSNKLDANALVSALKQDAKNLTAPYIANISAIMTGELQALFAKQLANLQSFYQMFSYVQTNINQFEENITLLAEGLRLNFTGTVSQFLDEYFREPLETFDYILQFTGGLEDEITKNYQSAMGEVKQAVLAADELLLGQLNSITTMVGYSNISDLIALSKETINWIKNATSGIANSLTFANSRNIMIYKIYSHCFTQSYATVSDELLTIHNDLQAQFYILQDIEVTANSVLSFIQKISQQASSNRSIPTKFSEVADFFYQTDDLEGTFNASLAKYQSILSTLTRLNSVLVSDFSCSINMCFEIDYPIEPTCDYDGDEAFYYRDRVIPVRNNLTEIVNKINQMLAALRVLNHLQGLKGYKQKIRSFSSLNYTKLTDYSPVLSSTEAFVNESKLILSAARNHYNNIITTRGVAMQDFIVGRSVRSLISNSFEALRNWTAKICQANQTSQNAISQLKGQFQRFATQIENYNNSLFNNAVLRINNTLGLLSQHLFQGYRPLNLCNNSITDQILSIQQFINDTANFQTAQQTISKLLSNITQSQQFVHFISDRLGTLSASVRKLRNAYDFLWFIGNSTQLVSLVRNYTSFFGAQIIEIKEELIILNGFVTMDPNRTLSILREFIEFPSNLNALTVLGQFEALLNNTSGFMGRINFNVLGTMLIITQSVAALENNALTIAQGCEKVVQDTSDLVAAFLELTDLVSQDYLIEIQQQFEKLSYDIDMRIRVPTLNTIKRLNETISGLNITQNSYKLMVAKVKAYVLFYQLQAHKLISKVDSQYKNVINSSLGFISTLKIGYMNELVRLGKDVSDFYKVFVSEFSKSTISVSSLGQSILKDVFKVKGTASVIDIVKDNIERAFNQSLQSITSSIDSRLRVISADAEVYSNLLSSNAYNKISTLTQDIMINFGPVWSGFESHLESIRSFEQSLTSGLVDQLNRLSSIRKELEGLEDSINDRITTIRDNFKDIVRQFSKIEKLVFGVLSNTIQDQVVNKLNNISLTVDAIFLQDLARLQNLTSANLPSSLKSIADLIQAAIDSYSQFKTMKDEMKSLLEAQIRSALRFLNDVLVSKFAILKDAQALIKSLPPMNPNQRSIILFNKNLAHEVIPVFKLVLVVITPIGPILITLQVNFYYGCDLRVGLSNFRDIFIEVYFYSGLQLQFIFAFDFGIIKFGSYFTGQIMNIGAEVGFRLKGIVPVTLIKQIADLPQLKESNSLVIEPYLYTQIYALSYQVGGFISYLWFKLVWLRIRICFRIRLFWIRIKFCIRFRIPIIIPYFKTHRFGYRFNGVQLARIKIFDFPLMAIRY